VIYTQSVWLELRNRSINSRAATRSYLRMRPHLSEAEVAYF
jgi:hypothetical protein